MRGAGRPSYPIHKCPMRECAVFPTEQTVLIVPKTTMLAAAMVSGTAATRFTNFDGAVSPAAQSTSMAPVVGSIRRPIRSRRQTAVCFRRLLCRTLIPPPLGSPARQPYVRRGPVPRSHTACRQYGSARTMIPQRLSFIR